LEIRDTLGTTGGATDLREIYSIAADDSFNVLYAHWWIWGGINGLRVSFDGGRTWEGNHPCGEVLSGVHRGEISVTAIEWSTDFGRTFTRASYSGGISVTATANGAIGWSRGESYLLINSDPDHIHEPGDIFKFVNYGDTFWQVSSLGHVGEIFNGGAPPEMYLYAYDTIYLSLDSYESLEFMGITPVVFDEVIGGKSPCELYGYRSGVYSIPMEGIHGGWMEIWHSSDCGRSWRMIARHDSRGERVIEGEAFLNSDFDYKLENGRLTSNEYMYLLDLSGRLCGEGMEIDLTSKRSGIYFLSNGKIVRKVLWIR